MAKKGSRATKPTGTKPAARAAAAPAAQPRMQVSRLSWRQDPRRWIYIGFDLLFTIGYVWAFSDLLHNRFGWARSIFYLLPLCTTVMAIGVIAGRRWSWWITVVSAAVMLIWTVGFIILLLVTASYLAGVYGAFGKAASSGVMLSTAFVIQFVATLPALQLKWALTRGGRRAFGLPPLWRAAPGAAAGVTAAA